MTHNRTEQIGDATLYLADCRDVLPGLTGVGAVVTDPPYGIGKDGQKRSTGVHGGRKAYEFLGWDSVRPSRETFSCLLQCGDEHIIWGEVPLIGNQHGTKKGNEIKWLTTT